jgi:hypothetical protein
MDDFVHRPDAEPYLAYSDAICTLTVVLSRKWNCPALR